MQLRRYLIRVGQMEKIAASIAQIAAEAQAKPGTVSRPSADLPSPVMAALAAWIADQPDPKPSLPDAIHKGLAEWLAQRGYLRPCDALTPE